MNEIQKTILDIFKQVSLICEAHNIPYYAIGGTCIGAVRHKGFIPWDDDMDIAIPIEDYERFIDISKKELPEHLEVFSGKDHPQTTQIFIKIVNKNTTFIESHEKGKPDAYKGVFLDVMPLGGIPEKGFERKIYYLKLKHYLRMNYARRKKMEFSLKPRQLFRFFLHGIAKKYPYDHFYDKYYELLGKYKFKDAGYTGYTWCAEVTRLTFPKKYFEKMVKLPFEDTMLACPCMYDKYLSAQFGDYMTLPKLEDRNSGHYGIIDLQVPYEEYKEKEI